MKLTRGKLMKQNDWSAWNESEHLQLDQYDKQFMFGNPVPVEDESAIFHLVWTYVIKELDGCKKARSVCDGSSRSGQVRVLDHTYANCVDRTGSRFFYAISAAENMLVYGADVSNAFAEAPPPKQGFFIYPDRAFNDWWVNKKGNPPIPDGHVIPVLGAMQGRVPPEYSPAHARSTGQFDKPSIEMVPDSYTTKNTLTTASPADDSHIPITARAAHIYSPDYSAVANNHWTQIVATASCLPYNPTLHYQHRIVGGC